MGKRNRGQDRESRISCLGDAFAQAVVMVAGDELLIVVDGNRPARRVVDGTAV